MSRLKLFIATSLDGYIASPDGSVDWLFHDQDYGYTEFYNSIGSVILGRKTYEQILTFGDYPYADKKSYLLTRNDSYEPIAGVEVVTDRSADFVLWLKDEPAKDIWLVGGAEVVQLFLAHHFIDDLILFVHPILLGQGIPLFPGLQQSLNLHLKKTLSYESGVVQLHYEMV